MPLSLTAMQALFPDNTAGDISAEDGRDVIGALYDWIPRVEKYRVGRLPGETAHAADDFFTSYSGYTEQTPTGTATWGASRGGLSCKFVSITAADFAATLKAVPAAGVPITIETQFQFPSITTGNPTVGLLFTDGTATTSNLAGFGPMDSGGTNQVIIPAEGTLTSVTSNIGAPIATLIQPLHYLRVIWKSANTFATTASADGETWVRMNTGGSATFTRTFTPTHMGFYVSNWTGSANATQHVVFNYLRVYEADLSIA